MPKRVMAIGLLAILAGCSGPAVRRTAEGLQNPCLDGTVLITANDGDATGPALVSGNLPEGPRPQDSLTIVRLSAFGPRAENIEGVGNTVSGSPRSVAVTPDGSLALVAEGLGRAPIEATELKQTPVGQNVYAVALDGENEGRVSTIRVGLKPETVSIHSGGNWALVSLKGESALAVLRVSAVGVSLFAKHPLEAVPNQVAFSPDGETVMVVLPLEDAVEFYRFDEMTGELTPLGERVAVDDMPFTADWHPDGTFAFVSCVHWDHPGAFRNAGPGSVVAVAVDKTGGRVADRIEVGVSPEGLAVAPSGRQLVVALLQGSFLPVDNPIYTETAALELLAFDEGRLRSLGRVPTSRLPEGVAFTWNSECVAASSFTDSTLRLFEVTESGLKAKPLRVPLGTGPASMTRMP